MFKALPAAAVAALLFVPATVSAGITDTQTINLAGAVLNTCILTVTTPGVLSASSVGTEMSSEAGSGVPAVLAVVSTGTKPTLGFAAPTLDSPAGIDGTPTVAIRYNSLGGAVQGYTSSASSTQSSRLLDTFTIHARAQNTQGFATGTYTVSSTVTCQQ